MFIVNTSVVQYTVVCLITFDDVWLFELCGACGVAGQPLHLVGEAHGDDAQRAQQQPIEDEEKKQHSPQELVVAMVLQGLRNRHYPVHRRCHYRRRLQLVHVIVRKKLQLKHKLS